MEHLREIPESDVWTQYAAAEVSSPRYAFLYDGLFGRTGADRLRTVPASEWTEGDRKAAREGVWILRYGYLTPLMPLVTKWFSGELPIGDLSRVRLIRHGPFTELAPSRQLGEFVKALDAGRDTPGDDFAKSYRRLRPTFDPHQMRGDPILVAESTAGPFLEVEGLARISCLLSMRFAGEPVPSEVRVVLGVSPRLAEWNWY